jgi:hypothetical protein
VISFQLSVISSSFASSRLRVRNSDADRWRGQRGGWGLSGETQLFSIPAVDSIGLTAALLSTCLHSVRGLS